ncbi:HEAT domain containing protein [Rippkaea orientalis PCC 8801]|uniref:HEAT domain containing protein n=1 Tax=Rippkaea orientalis (strain PCC 8801 / RF-1) TaxID=41431 RepID=B7JX66_RIPO1|nr:HEAT repeat domain-containing protein [Rippkaea orientalis]ACK67054.1 HEAT domain containing protein [Rippkaea orientalis PCC 8801]
MTNQDIQLLIQAVEKADSANDLLETVENLAEARHPEAIATLIQVLGYNNPGAAVAAVEGLIHLGDLAVPILLEQIDGYNYGARAWATRALAGIGHPKALDLLIEAAKRDFALSVRRSAAKGLGNIRWAQLPDAEVTPAQTQALDTLITVSQDPEWVVRYAASVSLEQLATSLTPTQPTLVSQILQRFNKMMETEEELSVKARVQWALQNLCSLET